MNTLTKVSTVLALVAGGAMIAHAKVTNPAVKARQAAMSTIGDSMKVLGGMAKGKMAFDAEKASAATAAIVAKAKMVPQLFEAQETDPETEAKPEIWANWEKFTGNADALQVAAGGVDTTSLEGVQTGVMKLAEACKECHKEFRIKKD